MSRAALLSALLLSLCAAPPLYAASEDDDDGEDDAEVEPKPPPPAEPMRAPLAEPPKATDAKDSDAKATHAKDSDAKDSDAKDSPVKPLPLAGEGGPPRPPLPEVEPPTLPAPETRLEVGGGLAWVSHPFAEGLGTSGASYDAAPGFTLRLDWQIVSWLRFHPYFVWARHDVTLEAAALATTSPTSIEREAVVGPLTATTFAFGARVAPTLELSPRWRGWLAAGIGYGRMGLSDTSIVDAAGNAFALGSRDGVFVEAPVALGVAFEAIPRWLAIVAEASAAPVFGQSGAAHESVQAIDATGAVRDVGPLGAFEASFVQSIGVALIL